MNKILPYILVGVLACNPSAQNLDRFADAAKAICDGMSLYTKYEDRLVMIKALVDKHDYMTALFYAKALYVDVQGNGDPGMIPEVVSLVTVLENLASKVPLVAPKPDSGNKLL